MADKTKYICPACGEKINNANRLVCGGCGREFSAGDLNAYTSSLSAVRERFDWRDSGGGGPAGRFRCSGCGVVLNGNSGTHTSRRTLSVKDGETRLGNGGKRTGDTDAPSLSAQKSSDGRCPFCGEHLAPIDEQKRGLNKIRLPQSYSAIPFSVSKSQACAIMRARLRFKPLIPSACSASLSEHSITGVYLPIWTYSGSADVAAHFRTYSGDTGEGGEKAETVALRRGFLDFRQLAADALCIETTDLIESIYPYDLEVPCDRSTGRHPVVIPDISPSDALTEIDALITNRAVCAAAETIECPELRNERCEVAMSAGHIGCVLLPVWLYTFIHDGKKTILAVNGQSGKCSGSFSADRAMWWRMFAAISAVLTCGCTAALFLLT